MTEQSSDEGVRVERNDAESRFEIHVGDRLAGFAEFQPRDEGAVVAITHTEIDDAFAGQGLAKRLAADVLTELADGGLGLLPYCPFFASYLGKHPEHAGLVPEARRAEFGL